MWNWLYSMNENPIGSQKFEFGGVWQEMVKQFLLCKII